MRPDPALVANRRERRRQIVPQMAADQPQAPEAEKVEAVLAHKIALLVSLKQLGYTFCPTNDFAVTVVRLIRSLQRKHSWIVLLRTE
jgi:hypothetical protein